MKAYDYFIVALGNFMHSERTLKECFLKLADFIGMGILLTFLGYALLAKESL